MTTTTKNSTEMVKVLTGNLIRESLDWAVAMCEGVDPSQVKLFYEMALTGQASLSEAIEYLTSTAADNEAERIKKDAEIDAQADAAEAHAEERMVNQPEEEYMAECLAEEAARMEMKP
jgi:hypothetical protein